MGTHMTPKDLDDIFKWKEDRLEPTEIHEKLCEARREQNRPEPDLTIVRRALRGRAFKRSKKERRGQKRRLSARNLATMDRARDKLIQKADSEYEVLCDDVVKASRVPSVHRTTAANNIANAGHNVKFRKPRLKPWRSDIDEAERKRMCNKLRKAPTRYWQHTLDMHIDNKRWKLQVNSKGKKYLRMSKVRGHLREPSEGLKKGCAKPSGDQHKVNTGGSTNVLCCYHQGARAGLALLASASVWTSRRGFVSQRVVASLA